MTEPRRYHTPAAFRTALEERQKQRAAQQGVPFNRVAQIDLYFRFLDRLVREFRDGALVVKGGLALEMRLQRARTTRDIDLRVLGQPEAVYERIRHAGMTDLDDYLSFVVNAYNGKPEIDGDGVIYGGRRFVVQAMMASQRYRDAFGLDVVFGDPLVRAPERLVAPDAVSFAGIAPPEIPIYPLGTHLAEKLHAYTLPREGPNSRMKDIIDIALVACEPALKPSPAIDAAELLTAMRQTFAARNTHALPDALPALSARSAWATRYPRDKQLNELPWASIDEVHAEVARFLDPVLAGAAQGSWHHDQRAWR